jgi:hypothetical protein
MARKKQADLPGMERKTIREVNDAAEAKQALISAMQKHELSVYRDDSASPPLVVTLVEGKVNVKVALESDDGPEEVRAA